MNSTVDRQKELREKIANLCGYTQDVKKFWFAPGKAHDWRISLIDDLVPDYCNDLNAAFTLCDVAADAGWIVAIDNGLDKTWECTFEQGPPSTKHCRCHYVPHDSLAMAICLAFVKTMEATSVQGKVESI